MKALVLAAGKGSRLGPAAGGMPKPLVDVNGTTPLECALDLIVPLRPERIWINVHEHVEPVRARIGATARGVPIAYSYEPELLGTAGAWKKLETEWTDTSLVVYGDNVMRFDVAALIETHRRAGRLMTIAVFDPAHVVNTGIAGGYARVDRDRVVDFVEGGGTGMVNAGAYCIEPALRSRLEAGFSDFGRDVLPSLARTGELAAHVLEPGAWCLGLDTPERLEIARSIVAGAEVAP